MILYILKNLKDGTYYTGITNNVDRRLKEHNSGKVKSTKNKKPWKILHTEEYSSIQEARDREKFLKSYGGVKEKRAIIRKFSGIV